MKVLIIKSIFILNHAFIDKNYGSIKSLMMCIKSIMDVYPTVHKAKEPEILFDVKLCGWIYDNINDNMNDNIDDNMNENNIKQNIRNIIDNIRGDNEKYIKYSFDIFDKNHGKVYTLKNIKKFLDDNTRYDLILYSDHDIIFTDEFTIYLYSMIFRNINPIDEKIKMISLNQLEDPRHNPIINNNKAIINNIEYFYSNNNIHIASGCFITDTPTIKMISRNLPDTKYVYGNEDILIGNLFNKHKYIHLVTACYNVIHPIDTDIEYTKWKKQSVIRYLLDTQTM